MLPPSLAQAKAKLGPLLWRKQSNKLGKAKGGYKKEAMLSKRVLEPLSQATALSLKTFFIRAVQNSKENKGRYMILVFVGLNKQAVKDLPLL